MTLKDLLEDEREEGRAEGFKNGSLAKACEMAKAFLEQGFPVDSIAKASGLSVVEIKNL